MRIAYSANEAPPSFDSHSHDEVYGGVRRCEHYLATIPGTLQRIANHEVKRSLARKIIHKVDAAGKASPPRIV